LGERRNILFLRWFGTHQPMTQEEVEKKPGAGTARKYPRLDRNAFDNMKTL
jgi:nickel-dependent lactate racemase